MTNEAAGLAPTPENATGPVLALQSVYLKDCSYEAPNGPRVDGNWNPQINLDLHTAATPLAADVREIVLTVTVSAKQNDNTIFLVEV
jgi:preprotein translocase subunit SecB